MALRQRNAVISGAAPSTATGAAIGSESGFEQWASIAVTAQYAGNTGGTLDVYVQRFDPGLDAWVDWIHFPQAAAGASAARYTANGVVAPADIYTVGVGTSPALTADAFTGGHPGNQLRVYAVSGASTTAGATVTVSFVGQVG